MHDVFGILTVKNTKPLGLPYKGTKRKYADVLINKMSQMIPYATHFYDLFGGGGAMSFAAYQKGLSVHYNEIQPDLVSLLLELQISVNSLLPPEYYKFVNREMFYDLRNSTGVYAEFVRLCYSFGNNQINYAFSRENEKLKNLAHDAIIFGCKDSLNLFNCISDKKLTIDPASHWHENKIKYWRDTGDQLQHLSRLYKLENLKKENIVFPITNLDYRDVKITTPIEETIVYCDPPYKDTQGYRDISFNHAELYEWLENSPYTIFMSEYDAPFTCINEISVKSSLPKYCGSPRVEKLFVNRLKK